MNKTNPASFYLSPWIAFLLALAIFVTASRAFAGCLEMLHLPAPENAARIVELEDRLKFDSAGGIEFDRRGFPDRFTYRAAQVAQKIADEELDENQGALMRRLRSALEKTRQRIYSGENSLLLHRRYQELQPGDRKNFSLLEYVKTERYLTGIWWMRNDENYNFHRQPAPPDITYDSTRSDVLKSLGPGAYSYIYWPVKTLLKPNSSTLIRVPDLNGPHIRVNFDATGTRRSVEMNAPVGRVLVKRAMFMFEQIGDEWIPRVGELNRDTRFNCARCHSEPGFFGGGRVVSKQPVLLKAFTDFQSVGIKDPAIVEQFLRGH